MIRFLAAVLALGLAAGIAPVAHAQALEVTITRPAQDDTVHDNEGNVSVIVAVEPALAPGSELVLLLDDRPAARQRGPVFALMGVERGTHTLQAQVIDARGVTLATSAPVTFHMWQASRLFPGRKGK